MKAVTRLGLTWMVAVAVACGGDDDGDAKGEGSLAEALTRGVKFRGGVLRKGELPETTADQVRLVVDTVSLVLEPDQASLLQFRVENPDEDEEPVTASLMQFEGAADHTEVPADDSVTRADAGSAQTPLLDVENPFDVDADICSQLCNKRYSSRILIAVLRADGSVSRRATRALVLDCRQDGDPDRCEDAPRDDAGMDGGAGSDAAPSGGSGGSGGMDAGMDAGGDVDAGPVSAPQIGLLSPATATSGMSFTLTITGTGFIDGAVAYLDGQALPTTFVSETELEAEVAAEVTAEAGNLAVYVQNREGDVAAQSNVLYVQVTPAPGAPVVYDYSPDNGLPGDTILIIASNLANQDLTIVDAEGNELTPGAIGTISWPNAGSTDTVEVVLPDDIASGPITVANALGAFKGKIFTVGQNLTRLEGTVLDSSTEYNTGNWGRASGGDNQLRTSFFTAHGDCASLPSCTTVPWYSVTFPSPQTVARIAFRGNREYASGYDFLEGTFEVLDGEGEVLWSGSYELPGPDRDLDIALPEPVEDALTVRFTSLADESDEPGFSELEVFGP